MKRMRNLSIGATFLAVLARWPCAGLAGAAAEAQAAARSRRRGSKSIRPSRKPLPNGMYQGQSIGLWVDSPRPRLDRPSPRRARRVRGRAADQQTGECCKQAPPILEFDPAGQPAPQLGRPGRTGLPVARLRTTASTSTTRATSGSAATARQDGHILKFTQDGKFVMQVGKKGVTQNSMAQDHFFQVAETFFHAPANEVFVADGYGNRRVAVIDADSGKIKRFWGAYGTSARRQGVGRAGRVRSDGHLPALPRPRALREGVGRRPRLRLRPDQQPHPGVQDRRHVRPRDLHAARLARRRLDVGRRVLDAIRSSGSSTSPTAATRRSGSSTARRMTSSRRSARAATTPASGTRCTTSRPTEGQPVHGRDLSGPPAAAVPLQGPRAGHVAADWRRVSDGRAVVVERRPGLSGRAQCYR